MTPLVRLLRNFFERFFGRYYEGPSPPKRLDQVVMLFARMNPHATRAEWAKFAISHAQEGYRVGYVRGWEWAERDLDNRDPKVDPDILIEIEKEDFAWFDEAMQGFELPNPDAEVPTRVPEDRALQEQVRYQEEIRQYFKDQMGVGPRR